MKADFLFSEPISAENLYIQLMTTTETSSTAWTVEELRARCLDLGADDVGFVSIDRDELDDQRDEILAAMPTTRTLVSFVVRMNRAPIRSPARSIANLEFHHTGHDVDEVGRRIVELFEGVGVDAMNPAMGFPMEADRFPGRLWVVSHKPVAVAAGLGRIGIHRNLIHPKFGNFVLLGTVLVAADVSEQGAPIEFNPCLECKLCVAACPVGAIQPDGNFDFSACYTHNYREFMGGFTDWVEQVADSKSARDYRSRVSDGESTSMWQSLSYGANYKAAYCLAACPAGEDVIGPFVEDKAGFVQEVVKPLQQKTEPVYVVPASDAEAHVQRRFPHKPVRHVGNSLRPASIDGFVRFMPLTFQREKSRGLDVRIHFEFTGEENAEVTVHLDDGRLVVERGFVGEPNLRVRADSATWLGFLRNDRSLVWSLLTRRIRLRGNPKHLMAFGKCFLR